MVVKNRIIKKSLRALIIIICAWVVVALLISSTSIIANAANFNLKNFLDTVIYEIICLSPWIVLTPFLIKIGQKFRLDWYALPTFMGVHIGTALVIFSLHTVIQSYASSFQYDITFNWTYLGRDFLGFLDMRVMLYLGVLLIVYIVDFQNRERATKLKKARLQNQLNLIKIQALLNKFQPVFFMNCIDAIQRYLKSDAEKSEEILNNFSDLLRIMLQNMQNEEVTIQEDLETLYLYLDLLDNRMGSNIKRDIQFEDDCLDVLVPPISIFIPIMEEVLEFVPKGNNMLLHISYKAIPKQKKFIGEIKIGIQDVSLSNLIEHFENKVLQTLNEYLQTKYGEKAYLHINTKEEYLGWTLSVPLVRKSLKFIEES